MGKKNVIEGFKPEDLSGGVGRDVVHFDVFYDEKKERMLIIDRSLADKMKEHPARYRITIEELPLEPAPPNEPGVYFLSNEGKWGYMGPLKGEWEHHQKAQHQELP